MASDTSLLRSAFEAMRPNPNTGAAGAAGLVAGAFVLIAFAAMAGLDLSRFTLASIITAGLCGLAPAIYFFRLKTKHNEAIKREMASLEGAGE
ncbi:hypothetical protein [Bradyrhizobium sp. JYMT SZCCT0428]|uniref:hypothetical protein n=1 Tax=Bradyrhizobium sp. JYMT SZCCT0428 TaxID=2807673 RepID=UPI001BA5548C|nr:hypothetical protein [Bradyrhizobium sp. JYMT SZCCT0428]MBR1157465.1 hypothetical protein [Bradyrhizobium sp. JYMT SZCCT0428]